MQLGYALKTNLGHLPSTPKGLTVAPGQGTIPRPWCGVDALHETATFSNIHRSENWCMQMQLYIIHKIETIINWLLDFSTYS